MKEKEDYEKMKGITASFSLGSFSLSIDKEFIEHIEELKKTYGIEISHTEEFENFAIKESQLDKNKIKSKTKEFMLDLFGMGKRGEASEKYRVWLANMLIELHPRKEIKERYKKYLKNGEYKRGKYGEI